MTKSLKELRVSLGLSPTQVGAAVGVSGQYIWALEHGSRKPSVDVLRNLATFYRVEPGLILDALDPDHDHKDTTASVNTV